MYDLMIVPSIAHTRYAAQSYDRAMGGTTLKWLYHTIVQIRLWGTFNNGRP